MEAQHHPGKHNRAKPRLHNEDRSPKTKLGRTNHQRRMDHPTPTPILPRIRTHRLQQQTTHTILYEASQHRIILDIGATEGYQYSTPTHDNDEYEEILALILETDLGVTASEVSALLDEIFYAEAESSLPCPVSDLREPDVGGQAEGSAPSGGYGQDLPFYVLFFVGSCPSGASVGTRYTTHRAAGEDRTSPNITTTTSLQPSLPPPTPSHHYPHNQKPKINMASINITTQ